MERNARIALNACAAILAIVFIYAGGVKMMRPDLFLQDILSYRILDYRIAYFVAYGLPPLEIVCGLGVLLPRIRKESAFLIFSMMLVFAVALISAWVRGLDISCGCFGSSDTKANYPLLLLRDLALIGISLPLIFWPKATNLSSNNTAPI